MQILIGRDLGGRGLDSFSKAIITKYMEHAQGLDNNNLVNKYLQFSGRQYKPFVMVSSCPGDQ